MVSQYAISSKRVNPFSKFLNLKFKGYKMDKNKIMMSLAMTSILVFSGCANKAMKDEAAKSGFLGNYSDLKEDKKYPGAAAWVSPNADFKKYNSIVVMPVQVNHGIGEKELTPVQKQLFQEMSDYLTRGLVQQIQASGRFEVVSVASPSTMQLEVRVGAVSVNHDDMKFYQFIPVALVATGIARVTNISKASVRILGEGRLSDSGTNEALIRSMGLQKGQEISSSGQELVFADVKPALDHFLNNSAKRLVEISK